MQQGPTTPTSPGDRPRTRSRGISFRSDKSGASDPRSKITESPKDKAQRDSVWKGTTKANPNAAINEAQPGVANVIEESTLQNIRDGQHRDAYGNVIADPDRSNPTRPRLERPLDTIRSFERAIDDGYKRRSTYIKPDGEQQWDKDNQFASRRSSYFSGYENGPSPNRPASGVNGGYYGNQSYNGPPRARYGGNRMQQEPQGYNGQRPYPQHGYHQSHDTVNTGYTNGSDSTGPWANSTDPSSENSSIDKVKPPMQDGYNQYGGNGYNGPIMEEQGAMNGYGGQSHGNEYGQASNSGMHDYGYSNGSPDHAQRNGWGPRDPYSNGMGPPQQPTPARQPIKLGGSGAPDAYGRPPANLPPTPQAQPEKKQGWLKRRFSKKA